MDYFDRQPEWSISNLSLSGASGWSNQDTAFDDAVFSHRPADEPFLQGASYFEDISDTSINVVTQVNATGKDILGLYNAFLLNAAA